MYQTPTGGILLPEPPSADRRIKMGVKGHFTGTLVFGEGQGRAMEMASHTQMQVALIMLARREVVDLENKVPFGWTDEKGASRTYRFQFRVSLRDGSRVALFVTNARTARSERFLDKRRRIAAQVTSDFADRVRVMTDEHIDPVEAHNAELIHSVREPDPEADAAARRAVAGISVGAAKIGDLIDSIGLRGRGFRAAVRLIRTHEIELATHERITHDAFVRRSLL